MRDYTDVPAWDTAVWTFPETICWIKWRCNELVQNYRSARLATSQDGYMYFLWWALEHFNADDDIYDFTKTAKQELWKKLQNGNLKASGLRVGKDTRSEISALDFADLDIVEEDQLDVLRNVHSCSASVCGPVGPIIYMSPRLAITDVMERWPERGTSHEQQFETSALLGRSGRKKGSGSFDKLDEPFLVEMKTLIESNEATSVHNAATKVAPKAKSLGTLESTRDRLAKKYKAKYPE